MLQQWHYQRNGEPLGPVSSRELRQLAEAGEIQADTPLMKAGHSKWVPANKVKGLFPAESPPEKPPRPSAEKSSPPRSAGVGPIGAQEAEALTGYSETAHSSKPVWGKLLAVCMGLCILMGGAFILYRNDFNLRKSLFGGSPPTEQFADLTIEAGGDRKAEAPDQQDLAAGNDVAKDDAQVMKEQRVAAEAGDPEAMFVLGYRYSVGQGVAKDEAQAVVWYRKAAEADHATAMFNLGHIYHTGEDYSEAITWYRKSATAGDRDAMRSVAEFYRSGAGIQRDLKEAKNWYEKAVAAGDVESVERLATLNQEIAAASKLFEYDNANRRSFDPDLLVKLYEGRFEAIGWGPRAKTDIVAVMTGFTKSGVKIDTNSINITPQQVFQSFLKLMGPEEAVARGITLNSEVLQHANYMATILAIESNGGIDGEWAQTTGKNLTRLVVERANQWEAMNSR